jgi:hypothetical protein
MITTVTHGISGGWDPLAGVSGIPVSVPSTTCKEKSLQGFNMNNHHIKTLPVAVFYPFSTAKQVSLFFL